MAKEKGDVRNRVVTMHARGKPKSTARRRSEQITPPFVADAPQTFGGKQLLLPPRYYFDASLLFRCMDLLHIDRREFAQDDPLLFRELQGLCTLCRSKDECSRNLARGLDCFRWDKWWVYCPNSALLTMIEAVQNRDDSTYHLKVPLRHA